MIVVCFECGNHISHIIPIWRKIVESKTGTKFKISTINFDRKKPIDDSPELSEDQKFMNKVRQLLHLKRCCATHVMCTIYPHEFEYRY